MSDTETTTDPAAVDAVVSTTETVICFVEPMMCGGQRYNNGHVLAAYGEVVEFELSQQGRLFEEWLISELPSEGVVGILVWEGDCENKWCMNHGNDWEPRLSGSWRKPTAAELWSLVPSSC
tara:strand:- start:20254 stop:20616 length:363 start_codon:yes stop_codon:yes gene_type:complete